MGSRVLADVQKKREAEILAIYDTMERNASGRDKVVNETRSQAAGGYKVPLLSHINNFDTFGQLPQSYQQSSYLNRNANKMTNPLDKQSIYDKLGIYNPEDEFEFDANAIDGQSGLYKTKGELAENLIPALEKLREKNSHRREIIAQKMKNLQEKDMLETELQSGFPQRQDQKTAQFGFSNANPHDLYFDSQIPGNPNATKQQLDEIDTKIARDYGASNTDLPINDEQNQLHSGNDRYQLLHHWTSSLEKPNLENVELLRTMHEDKMTQVERQLAEKRALLEKMELQKQEQTLIQDHVVGDSRAEVKKLGNQDKRDYKSRFQNYLNNKNVLHREEKRSLSRNKKEFDRFECTSKNPKRRAHDYNVKFRELERTQLIEETPADLEQKKSLQKSRSFFPESHRKTPEEEALEENKKQEVVNWLWKRIDSEKKGAQFVPKQQIVRFFMENSDVMEAFGMDPLKVSDMVECQVTEVPDCLNYYEFQQFMLANEKMMNSYNTNTGSYKNTNHHNNISGREIGLRTDPVRESHKSRHNMGGANLGESQDDSITNADKNKECLLTEECVSIMKEIFQKLDKYGDLVVTRHILVKEIREDPRMKKYLNKGVVWLQDINREVALRKVLHQIEEEELLKANQLDEGDQNFISTKKYISWSQFLEYFTNYRKNQQVTNIDQKFKKDNFDDQNQIEMSGKLMEQLKREFGKLENTEGYVKILDYLDECRNSLEIRKSFQTNGRTKGRYCNLPDETLEQVLVRIQKEADEFIDWDEFIQFFTKRGYPINTENNRNLAPLTKGYVNISGINPNEKFIEKGPSNMSNVENLYERMEKNTGGAQILESYPGNNPILPLTQNQNGVNYQSQMSKNNEIKGIMKPGKNVGFYEDHQAGQQRPSLECEQLEQTQPFQMSQTQQFQMKPERAKIEMDLEKTQPRFEDEYNQPNDLRNFENNSKLIDLMADPMVESRLVQNSNRAESRRQSQPNRQGGYDARNRSYDNYNDNNSGNSEEEDEYINYKNKRMKITVPRGFSASQRGDKSHTISKGKFDQYISQLNEADEQENNYVFRAQEIPETTTKPLFQSIMHNEQLRREEVKKNSVAITKANEKPFSFYERDKNREKKFKFNPKQPPLPFKANEVPWFCSTELYQEEFAKKEQLRKEKINKRAQESLAISKLPPRMEHHEQERKHRNLLGGPKQTYDYMDDCTFQPTPAKPMPDYDRSYANFKSMLDKTKGHKIPTRPQPFDFAESKRNTKIDYLDIDNELRKKEMDLKRLKDINDHNLSKMRDNDMNKSSQFQPNITAKTLAQYEITRKQALDRQKKQEDKDKFWNDKKRKHDELSVKVRENIQANEALRQGDRPEQRKNDIKKSLKSRTDEYNKQVTDMMEKIDNRPYMLDRGKYFLI